MRRERTAVYAVAEKKMERMEKVCSLDILLGAIAILLFANLVFRFTGIDMSELPKTVSVLWWSVVSVVVAVLASWGM